MRGSTEDVVFENSRGLRLAGRFEVPRGAARGYAVFAHCFTCTKDFPAATRVCRGLAANGIGTLRFDFTGLGESAGRFQDANFSTNVDDIVSAASFLGARGQTPRLLVGHSWGGTAGIVAAGKLSDVRAVATLASPSDPGHVLVHFPKEVERIRREGSSAFAVAGRGYRMDRHFIEDLEQVDFGRALERLEAALLILHSPDDETVPIVHAQKLYGRAHTARSFVSLPGADHVLSSRSDADYVASVLSAWATRYLEEPVPPRSRS